MEKYQLFHSQTPPKAGKNERGDGGKSKNKIKSKKTSEVTGEWCTYLGTYLPKWDYQIITISHFKKKIKIIYTTW